MQHGADDGQQLQDGFSLQCSRDRIDDYTTPSRPSGTYRFWGLLKLWHQIRIVELILIKLCFHFLTSTSFVFQLHFELSNVPTYSNIAASKSVNIWSSSEWVVTTVLTIPSNNYLTAQTLHVHCLLLLKQVTLYTVGHKKTCHSTFVHNHNFEKCCPILKILSLLHSLLNLQQGSCHISYRILNV